MVNVALITAGFIMSVFAWWALTDVDTKNKDIRDGRGCGR